jgi:Immunity protein 10
VSERPRPHGYPVRRAGVSETPELNCVTVGIAEDEDGSGRALLSQLALRFDEQDRRLGQDTYCVCDEAGAAAYGGVTRCVLAGDELVVHFTAAAAATLDLAGECRFPLRVDPAAVEALRTGLRRVLTGGRAGRGAPRQLGL